MTTTRCHSCNLVVEHALNLQLHISSKHDVSRRDDSGFEDVTWIVDGLEFIVLVNSNGAKSLFRCKLCLVESYEKGMESHVRFKHIISRDEIEETRMIQREEKKLLASYCELCWHMFPKGKEHPSFLIHLKSRKHMAKEKYVEGTGCDICKTIADPLRDHYDSDEHQRRVDYEHGSGCNICKKNINLLGYDNGSFETSIIKHMRWCKPVHDMVKQYVEGTGCDVCRLKIPTHEETNAHNKTEKKMQMIYKRFIAPRTRVKSARK